ncbi:TatD family hydrolase [Sphingobacterium paludis]|jgi:TatD DNase family protein|uniref:TatD DNase family protein n=1 Tax=Sphingobacterium paludis TaxID=1476465 RepID=A0A4R7CY71_9SPHI|nr:TatD family hydrolase [Sphingobacterium paludis]TDS12887.1 TatD DNase family protein [Sphingobacterium paludis]
MHVPYIDIHTHCTLESTIHEFSLPNIIISKNYLYPLPCSLGIHPWYIDSAPTSQLDVLHDHGKRKQILAIGECGLDKLCDTDWALQVDVFRKQITFANSVQKPLIIHCVRAYQECLQLLKQERVTVPVIFHGFDKHPTLAQQIYRAGYYMSFGPSILSGKKDDLIRQAPLDKIFLETDDKSTKIVDIYMYFCRVRNIDLNQLKERLVQNFTDTFNYQLGE